MRIFLLIIFITLSSCSNNNTNNNSIKIDINQDLTFDEFKMLIEKKGLEKDYPDINK